MNANQWREECVYISRIADKRGNVPEMNHDALTAVRYMTMQRNAATREGFHDSATYIGECLDDMGVPTLGSFLHDVADALEFDFDGARPGAEMLRGLADGVAVEASPAWQAFARFLGRERDNEPDARRRELLARLLGSVRKLTP